jgi:methylmalonyl-CoA epimerase
MIPLDHVGIAVDDAAAALDLYETLLDVLPYKSEAVTTQQVRTHFLAAGGTKLELLEALGPDSPIARHVARRGEGLHHLAFEVPDADAALQRLQDAGLRTLSDTPQPGADGKEIFFLHPKDTCGVLVEFCASTPVEWAPTFVETETGTRLAVYSAGRDDHPPLLLLHGAGGSTQLETMPLMRALEPHFRVLAVDFCGHGRSSFPDDDAFSRDGFTADRFAENARVALDHFGADVAHVFGFSMGGNMALQLARRHQQRVGRLAVHGANVAWDDDLVDAMCARLDADAIADRSPPSADRLAGAHTDWQRLFRALQPFVHALPSLTQEMLDTIAQLKPPTLVSAVDRDDLFPMDAPLTLHRQLPNARLAILPGDRHALPQAPLGRLAEELQRHFLA